MRKLVVLGVGLVIAGWAVYQFWYLAGLPPCPSAIEITTRILQHPATRQCASVTVSVEGCGVRLQGRVENATQRDRLREATQKIRGITSVNMQSLAMVDAPFCDVLDLLEPLQRHGITRNDGFKVRLITKEGRQPLAYLQGEHLIVEVLTPAQFSSFVYVDYYTTDGQVQHLFPNLQEALNFFPPRTIYAVGQPDGKHFEWKLFPPFGRELITVIATKEPLVFAPKAPRYDPEPARLYIEQLRQALPQNLNRKDITATFYLIETRAKP